MDDLTPKKKVKLISDEIVNLSSSLLKDLNIEHKVHLRKKRGNYIILKKSEKNRIGKMIKILKRKVSNLKVVFSPYDLITDNSLAYFDTNKNNLYISFDTLLSMSRDGRVINFMRPTYTEWHEFLHSKMYSNRRAQVDDFFNTNITIKKLDASSELNEAYEDGFLLEEIPIYINGLEFHRQKLLSKNFDEVESQKSIFRELNHEIEIIHSLINVSQEILSKSNRALEKLSVEKISEDDWSLYLKSNIKDSNIILTQYHREHRKNEVVEFLNLEIELEEELIEFYFYDKKMQSLFVKSLESGKDLITGELIDKMNLKKEYLSKYLNQTQEFISALKDKLRNRNDESFDFMEVNVLLLNLREINSSMREIIIQ